MKVFIFILGIFLLITGWGASCEMKKKEILERQQIEVEKKNKEEADQLNKKIIKLKTKCKKAGGVLVPFSSPTDVMWSCVKSDLFIDVGTLDEK